MKLYYATNNFGKVNSLQREFKEYDVTIEQFIDEIPESRSSEVQKIAGEKVLYAYEKLKNPVAASDAGFYIDALNGFPGTFVNFVMEKIGVEGILRLVAGKDRCCEFRECLAYIDHTLSEPMYFFGKVKGSLAETPRGETKPHLWGEELTKLFIPEGSTTTVAEKTYEEHLEWRKTLREKTSASRKFAEWFKDNRLI